MPTYRFRKLGVTNAQAADQTGIQVVMSAQQPEITQDATFDSADDLQTAIAGLAACGLEFVGEVDPP